MRQLGTVMRHLERYLRRRMELGRGFMAQLRGVQAGRRFGLGRMVRVLYPECLTVGDDVTIDDFGYLHCLSEPGVRIGSGASIDRNLWLHCGGRPDDYAHGFFEIGDNSYIGCNAVLGAGGGIRIGDHVLIGQSVNMHAENHSFEDPGVPIYQQGVTYKGIVVEDDCWIGSKVTILDGVTIGRGSAIGAGSVVTRSIPPYSVAMGAPAQVIRSRKNTDA